ncbi:hypothetical protein EFO98_01030 [Lactiplantibacillus argentoratensis]|uniref:Uncharacterized protein n=1 Tax=Lactiplantibacillus argentoratensis TaxID=271881 RepID=A0AAN1Q0J7_9LACO|nr:hypothetical protein D5289_00995 [Lactiplantibacillus plantarum]AYJ35081.1 hypothetical protein LPA65_04490 [Lactiplantibacillus argentoratensis]MCT4442384.1 hypothetical protein [Lactiplantibacillus argentoratensis]MPQ37553.1 hypothetical protein [Lactiplantibacillus plantarum]RDG02298.1 hypothetical protein DQM19_04520 [Lactiplantibacillus plantarum]
MEDQYLRRGLRLKSVSTAFQQLAEMPGSRCRTNWLSIFTLIRIFSSGSKLVWSRLIMTRYFVIWHI